MHSTRLIKEFFDGTALQKQLVAAYLVGSHVAPDEFETILAMEKPDETGGFVSWNTYKNKNYQKTIQIGIEEVLLLIPFGGTIRTSHTRVNIKECFFAT